MIRELREFAQEGTIKSFEQKLIEIENERSRPSNPN
jgi:hypothetical protein